MITRQELEAYELIGVGTMALTYSTPVVLESTAPDFSLKGTDEKFHKLGDFTNSNALVVVFICNHCPYVQAVQARINQLAKDFLAQSVRLVGINSNDSVKFPDDSFEAMKVHAKKNGYVFPYLHDETQEIARAYGAVCTPDFFAYSNDNGKFILKYRGRLDDSWKEPGQVKSQDLREALTSILQNKNPPSDQKPSMGCSIKWKT